jgi:hypothetical protein
LFQAGVTSLKTAGSGERSKLYQPTPKPSALMRVVLSIAAVAWWIRLFAGR